MGLSCYDLLLARAQYNAVVGPTCTRRIIIPLGFRANCSLVGTGLLIRLRMVMVMDVVMVMMDVRHVVMVVHHGVRKVLDGEGLTASCLFLISILRTLDDSL